MLKDIVIVWIFGGVISAILAAYWWRGGLNGKFGRKHRLRWLGSWRRMADRNRCLQYQEDSDPHSSCFRWSFTHTPSMP